MIVSEPNVVPPGGDLNGSRSSPRAGSLAEAVAMVERAFPVPGYLNGNITRLQYPTVYETVRRYIPEGGSILDFGAGPADTTAMLAALGYRCSAADDLQDTWHNEGRTREALLHFAREFGVSFHVLREGAPWPWQAESFDMVMMHHVLEHLPETPRDLLSGLLRPLKPGGVLLVTVPNAASLRKRMSLLLGRTNMPGYAAYYWNPPPWRGHRREYVRGDLAQMAEFLGLEVLELRGYHYMMMTRLPRAARAVYRAVTAIARDARDSWLLAARKPAGWRPALGPPGSLAGRLEFRPGAL